MLPSPAELTYFSEIANCLNLSRASRKLGVSQPSLSLAVKRLEDTLGTHLFVRHKKGVTLTPAGEQLLGKVKPLLQQWESTKIQVKDSHKEVQGSVTIGCRSITSLYMREYLIRLLEQYPKLEVNFKFQNSNKTTQCVIDSSIDVGIVVKPEEHCDLVIHKVDTIELSLWVGDGNKKIQDINSGEAVIICEPDVPQAQIIIKKLEKMGVKIARVVTANNLEVVAQFATDGLGIGILPTCVAGFSYPSKLKPVEDTPTCTEDLCIIYRYENKDVQAVKTVINGLKAFAAKSNDFDAYSDKKTQTNS